MKKNAVMSLCLLMALPALAQTGTLVSAADVDCNRVPAGDARKACFKTQADMSVAAQDRDDPNTVIARYAQLSEQLKTTSDSRRGELESEMRDLLQSNPKIAAVLTSSMAWEKPYYLPIAGMVEKGNRLTCREYSRGSGDNRKVTITDAAAYFVRGSSRDFLSVEFEIESQGMIPDLYFADEFVKTFGVKMSNGNTNTLRYEGKFRSQSNNQTLQTDQRIQRGETYRADFSTASPVIIRDIVCLER